MISYRTLIDMLEDTLRLTDSSVTQYILDRIDSDHYGENYKSIIGITIHISDKVKHMSNVYNKIISETLPNIDISKLDVKDRLVKPLIEYILFDFNDDDIEAFINGDPDIEMVVDTRVLEVLAYSDYIRIYGDYETLKEELHDMLIYITNHLAPDYASIYRYVRNQVLKKYDKILNNILFIPVQWVGDDLYSMLLIPDKK